MKKFILFLLIISGVVAAQAQGRFQQDGGRVEAIKIAYFTKRLNLSPEEAQKFWPVYNQYARDIRELRQQHRDLDEVSMEEKTVNIRKKYKSEFGQALPSDKVNQFYKVDKEFTTFLRNELQERREMRQMRKQ